MLIQNDIVLGVSGEAKASKNAREVLFRSHIEASVCALGSFLEACISAAYNFIYLRSIDNG